MINLLDPDGAYPKCAHPGCTKLAQDGYCDAGCCIGFTPRRAYCSEHSHRPDRVLEILGAPVVKQEFTRDEVRRIVMAMWQGAGQVYQSEGRLAMERDVAWRRAAREAGIVDMDTFGKTCTCGAGPWSDSGQCAACGGFDRGMPAIG